LRQKEKINDKDTIIVSELDYYEIGQVKTKKLHSTDNGSNFLQQIDYKYNIKGWITGINNPYELGCDLFAMKFEYEENGSEYTGNITSITWASEKFVSAKTYNYTYDNLSRLKTATYSDENKYGVNITYDLNGNIKTLSRNGQFENGEYGFFLQNKCNLYFPANFFTNPIYI